MLRGMSDDETAPSTDDIKARMADALERKHAGEQDGESHLDGHGKADHTHGKEGGPQQFRRKAI
jgi:hypothetical protein